MAQSESTPEIKSRRTKVEEADLDITPMIDITFLLLAFFVVVSKMDPQTAVTLPKAQYGFTVPEKNCVVFVVTRGDTPNSSRIFRGRSKAPQALFDGGTPGELEDQIGDYVENQLSARPKIQAILIKAEHDVRTGAVELVKRGISGSELGRTREIYVGVEENQ